MKRKKIKSFSRVEKFFKNCRTYSYHKFFEDDSLSSEEFEVVFRFFCGMLKTSQVSIYYSYSYRQVICPQNPKTPRE